ncbi:pilus assembly protein TadG-related protein [Paraburkholderia fungorum]|uniref:Pilus assembly protein TadG-related protein n=1 Tax=Paraburkholderia fungorum TaxID=134537 RepID=A0AAP5QCQ2_9BURK|nr:pilus assembly protein TadG-related protein [Paraburkholderia fungorum]MDT8839824.1 pilus assembly protein TadG-related protein [Paraburkholderia fungorum]
MKRSARKGRARVAGASGQALVPALIFLLVGCVGLYVAFNSFQMTSARIKLQNTADAAAYSAAVLQARDYNLAAYMNRAMVANQVTVAQAVALKSWVDDLDNLYTGGPADSLVNLYADNPSKWNTPKARGKLDTGPARAALDALLPTLVKGVDSINWSMSNLQVSFHNALYTAVPQLADAVVRRNQTDTHVTSGFFTSTRNAAQLAAWQTYTSIVTPSGNTGPDAFADVVTDPATLDAFVKNRDATRSTAPNYQQIRDTANRRCGPGNTITASVTHQGGTQLRTDKRGWESVDASMAFITITCIRNSTQTIGSHAGSANGNVVGLDWAGYGGYNNFGAPRFTQPSESVSAAMAEEVEKGSPLVSLDTSNGGLQPYQRINGVPLSSEAPRITIEVERSSNTLVKTAGLHGASDVKVDTNAAGGLMRALSSANAYFMRPDETGSSWLPGSLHNAANWARADGKTEYPSTFSPYWQAKLAPVSDAERAAAIADQIGQSTPVQP